MNEIISNTIIDNSTIDNLIIDNSIELNNNNDIPKKIFIIPYRDREQHRELFITYMTKVLEDEQGTYKFLFIHQNDKRPFNRGAMKNIGFLYVKDTYPHDYKDITLIFHDIDLMPWKKNIFDYETTYGVVKHYYGFTFALGGMFAIKAEDFEKINGFPNYWAWGFEDNLIQLRWLRFRGIIDRSKFLPIQHPNVLASYHGFNRTTSKTNENRYIQKDKNDIHNRNGITTIKLLKYTVDKINLHSDTININNFITDTLPNKDIKNENLKNIISRFSNDSNLYDKQNRIQQNRINQQRSKKITNKRTNFNKLVDTNFIKKKSESFIFKY